MKEIVHLKYKNGHEIWVRKGLKRGYKYFGIYTKKMKGGKKKHGRTN